MKPRFYFYKKWWDSLQSIPKGVQLEVLDAVITYATSGEYHAKLKPMAEMAFSFIKADIDLDNNNKSNRVNNSDSEPELELFFEDSQNETPIITKVEVVDTQFEDVWNRFGKKGNRKKAFDQWNKCSSEQKRQIAMRVDDYVASTPDRQFRQDMQRWINPKNKEWLNEINSDGINNQQSTKFSSRERGGNIWSSQDFQSAGQFLQP